MGWLPSEIGFFDQISMELQLNDLIVGAQSWKRVLKKVDIGCIESALCKSRPGVSEPVTSVDR